MRRLTRDDWAVLADRLQLAGDPRGATLAHGLAAGPEGCSALNPAAELAPLLAVTRWPITLICPPLDTPLVLTLYGVIRPHVEREARRQLPVGGSRADLVRALRRPPRQLERRVQRGRAERLAALARLVDPASPPRWAWIACRQLIRGDAALIRTVTRRIEDWVVLTHPFQGD